MQNRETIQKCISHYRRKREKTRDIIISKAKKLSWSLCKQQTEKIISQVRSLTNNDSCNKLCCSSGALSRKAV